ncbi:spore coat U domain-containing protein [bacterium]|nr:spore coat U domain-containing protein [bacterium]
MKRYQLFLIIALIVAFSHFAVAGTLSSNLDVGATVGAAGCSALSTTAISFGTVSPGTGAQANGAITITCSSGVNYSIALNEGLNFSGGIRRMVNDGFVGPEFMTYELFQDTFHANPWGNGSTAPGDPVNGTGNGSPQNHTVFGDTTADSTQREGAYQDTVNVTVTF